MRYGRSQQHHDTDRLRADILHAVSRADLDTLRGVASLLGLEPLENRDQGEHVGGGELANRGEEASDRTF